MDKRNRPKEEFQWAATSSALSYSPCAKPLVRQEFSPRFRVSAFWKVEAIIFPRFFLKRRGLSLLFATGEHLARHAIVLIPMKALNSKQLWATVEMLHEMVRDARPQPEVRFQDNQT